MSAPEAVLATVTGAQRAEFAAFVVLAPVAVAAALGMVFSRNAVHAALLLVVNLFCLAVLYLMLEAQFVFVVQLAVYAGAIMVLFLFVLMLLGVDRREALTETIRGQRAWAVGLGVVLLAGVTLAILTGAFPDEAEGLAAANQDGNVRGIGRVLFTRYILAFEATGVLLLVAGVAALVLARPERRARPGGGPSGGGAGSSRSDAESDGGSDARARAGSDAGAGSVREGTRS